MQCNVSNVTRQAILIFLKTVFVCQVSSHKRISESLLPGRKRISASQYNHYIPTRNGALHDTNYLSTSTSVSDLPWKYHACIHDDIFTHAACLCMHRKCKLVGDQTSTVARWTQFTVHILREHSRGEGKCKQILQSKSFLGISEGKGKGWGVPANFSGLKEAIYF